MKPPKVAGSLGDSTNSIQNTPVQSAIHDNYRIWQAMIDLLRSSRQKSKLKLALKENRLPLSYGQQTLWAIHRNRVDNDYLAYIIIGELDLQFLENSLNESVRRHSILRTTYTNKQGQPVQVIHPFSSFVLPVIDCEHLPMDKRKAYAIDLAHKELGNYMGLDVYPSIRAKVFRLNPQEHLLLLTMPYHIIDCWSVAILKNELSYLYEVLSRGEQPILPQLKSQYIDFVMWQLKWLQSDVINNLCDYWKKKLANLPELKLSIDKPHHCKHTCDIDRLTTSIPEAITESLRILAKNEGCTLFMCCLAVFFLQLYHYSSQEDIVVGSPISGRYTDDLLKTMGFFVNTLVLRADLCGNPTFRELLSRVKEITLSAYAHQDLPFQKIVEGLKSQRDHNCDPLFRVIFSFTNSVNCDLQLGSCQTVEVKINSDKAESDLSVSISDAGNQLQCLLDFRTDLYEREDMKCFMKHFMNLFHEITNNPNLRISEVMHPDQEKCSIRTNYNATNNIQADIDQIEHHLLKHKNVLEAAVIAIGNAGKDQLTAYVVTDRSVSTLSLRSYLRDKLSNMNIPVFVTLESMPLAPNGEIDKSTLASLAADNAHNELSLHPKTPTEKELATVFGEALGIDNVNMNDTFLTLGGNSLLAVRVVAMLRERLGVTVPLMELYVQTLKQIAKFCDERLVDQVNPN